MSTRGPVEHLTEFERRAVAMAAATNESALGKRLQGRWLDSVVRPFVASLLAHRTYVVGADWIRDWHPERGVLLAANHRTFYDQWLLLLGLFTENRKFFDRIYFPVRSSHAYETKTGMLINYLVGGGSLYPPIFRDRSKADFNKHALDRIIEFLGDPKALVGVHPEGTRGKGPDPYDLLKAQPGIGQMILQGRPVVIPAFVNGMSNDFVATLKRGFRRNVRRDNPIIAVFGEPVDYSEFTSKKPRAALYKKCSDKVLDHIRELGQIERRFRARCAAGEIDDSDPGWLTNQNRR